MNLKEALQALIDGKKIRPPNWKNNHYLRLDDYGIFDQNDEESSEELFHLHWELYEEKFMTLDEIFQALKQGKTVVNRVGAEIKLDKNTIMFHWPNKNCYYYFIDKCKVKD